MKCSMVSIMFLLHVSGTNRRAPGSHPFGASGASLFYSVFTEVKGLW